MWATGPPRVGGCRQRHAACLQSQRSSIVCPFSLQCSLQYLPWGPPFSTMQSHAGCAHFADSAIGTSLETCPYTNLTPAEPVGRSFSQFRLEADMDHVREHRSVLATAEKTLLIAIARRLPPWLSSDQLTLLGLLAMPAAGFAFAM